MQAYRRQPAWQPNRSQFRAPDSPTDRQGGQHIDESVLGRTRIVTPPPGPRTTARTGIPASPPASACPNSWLSEVSSTARTDASPMANLAHNARVLSWLSGPAGETIASSRLIMRPRWPSQPASSPNSVPRTRPTGMKWVPLSGCTCFEHRQLLVARSPGYGRHSSRATGVDNCVQCACRTVARQHPAG